MRRLFLFSLLAFSLPVFGQGTAAIGDYCSLGGTTAKVQGTQSTNTLQGIVPSCTVTVYLTGTTTKASIFSNASGTALSNPFTANAINSVNPGGWIFWAAVNTGYDIVLSGGIPPNTYAQPVTLTDRYPGFAFSGGGGSVTPCGSLGQIQVANIGGTGLDCDPAFKINTLTHTRISTATDIVNAFSSVPRAVVDPMDTQFLGGLAAAVAGTSGHTPTEVINAAADYGYCQGKTTSSGGEAWIILPAGWRIGITSIKLWSYERLGGESQATQAYLEHTGNTGPMITGHGGSDTIVCNGTTYTPGTPTNIEVAFIAISGEFTGTNDIGIYGNGFGWYNHDITGFGVQFGQQAIWTLGTSSYDLREGVPQGEIQGCADYTHGVSTGTCGAVQLQQLDGWADHIYASDAAEGLTGKGPGACYPNCAAIVVNNTGITASFLFPQISDIGVLVNTNALRGSDWRIDGSSMEAIRYAYSFGGDNIGKVEIDGACLSTSLQSNFNAGIATGCYAINNVLSQDNILTGIQGGIGTSFFGTSYIQCIVHDGNNSASTVANTWGVMAYQGIPDNTTPNNLAYCGLNNSSGSGRVLLPASGVVPAYTSTININGITQLLLASALTVTNFTNGIPGATLTIQASALGSATVAVGGNFHSCTGANEVLAPGRFIQAQWDSQFTGLQEICNNPNITPAHVNWVGNTTPSTPAMLDVYGDTSLRQIPTFTQNASQLHGTTIGSQACFEEEATFTSGRHIVTSTFCTNVDLSAQTAGEIFNISIPQASGYNLYLVSNAQGNGVPLGNIGPPNSGNFWDGPTTIAAGGDGTTPPPAGENTTGILENPQGYLGPATAPTGTCAAGYGGTFIISQDGKGTYCPVGGGTWTNAF